MLKIVTSIPRLAYVCGALVAFALFGPGIIKSRTTIGSVAVCADGGDEGSCAPRTNWDCIIDQTVRENKCDPDTYNCIIVPEA